MTGGEGEEPTPPAPNPTPPADPISNEPVPSSPSDPPNMPNVAEDIIDKGVKNMENYTIGLYSNSSTLLRVPKDQVKVIGLENDAPLKERMLCLVDDVLLGVTTEFLEDENIFIVDIDENKVYTSTAVEPSGKPEKIGCLLYFTSDNRFTASDTGSPVAIFMGMKGNAILFQIRNYLGL